MSTHHTTGTPGTSGIPGGNPGSAHRPTRRRTESPDLAALMARIAAGDHHAFATLYHHLAKPIYGLTHRLLRNHAHAEEVTQEVMIEIWRTAPRYRPHRGTVTTWALTLAHHRAVDRIRSQQAAVTREQSTATRNHTTAYDVVTDHIEKQQEFEQVRHCLHTLTPLQHQAITLAYYHGQTYRHIATSTNTPLGTIKTRIRDALTRLRHCMQKTA